MTGQATALHPKAPPIKIQGIKTRLVPLIAASVRHDPDGVWIEPFAGSCVVALNLAPARARLADTNEHLIRFYQAIQVGRLTGALARRHLEAEGERLLARGESHYYAVRDRFNEHGDPLDFLMLSRACFNGMMRFNSRGGFNVPFCRKPERFRPALISRIANQIDWAASVMAGRDWTFVHQPWQQTLAGAGRRDTLYCDPPYVGRHADYYNGFSEAEADALAQALCSGQTPFALSMWLKNRFRRNRWLDRWFDGYPMRTTEHFYHVGAANEHRHPMIEALVLSADLEASGAQPEPVAA